MNDLLIGLTRWLLLPQAHEMRRLHDSLFNLFGPGADVHVPGEIRLELESARERLWTAVQQTPRVQWLLAITGNLRLLRSRALCSLYDRYVAKIPTEPATIQTQVYRQLIQILAGPGSTPRSFADLSPAAQQQLIDFLLRSPLNFQRRIAASLRIFYVRGMYEGKTGRLVAGIGDHGATLMEATPGLAIPQFVTSLRYQPSTKTISEEVDYLIVGSGPAGSVVAHELQRAGKKVLIIEAGPFFVPNTFDARAGLDFYEDSGYRTTTDGGVFVLNGWVVGGGSTINADMAFGPGSPSVAHRIECWHQRGDIPDELWTPAEMDSGHRWVASQLGTRTVSEGEINEHNKVLFRGARNHGLNPRLYQLNTFEPGKSPFSKTDKRDAVSGFLMKLLTARDNPVTLIPDALAARVLIKKGRAHGVAFTVQKARSKPGIIHDPFRLGIPEHTTVKAYAKQVIVAGGTLGSATLLLKSGVKNPNVGAGFVMHPFCLVLGLFAEEINCHLGTSSSVYVSDYLTTHAAQPMPDFLLECASARPEIGALMLPGNGSQIYNLLSRYRYIAGIGILILDSEQRGNRVRLSAGQPEINYTLSEADKKRFRHGVAEGVRVMFKAGAEKVIVPTHQKILGDAAGADQDNFLTSIEQADLIEQRLNFCANEIPLFAAHMTSGNKIGPCPDKSVVSSDYQVWGVENLFVVDGSVFPGSVGANPMQSIYTIAKIFADRHLVNRES